MFELIIEDKVFKSDTLVALKKKLLSLPEDQKITVTHGTRVYRGTPRKAFKFHRKARKHEGVSIPNIWAILLKPGQGET